MIYHIITGDLAAAPLKEAIDAEPSMQGEVIVMKDVLSVGPLQKEEGQKFSDLRTAFWQEVVGSDKAVQQVDDLERLLQTGNELSKSETAVIWLWMAPLPADVCMYHWSLRYLGKYASRLYVVNIAGLPFLDEQGKIFFPKSIAEIYPKELIKARKLARPVTSGEMEVDTEEWRKLVNANGGVRTLEGGKRMSSRNENHYDNQLISFTLHQYQKASRIVAQALSKFALPTGDVYLGWRLRKMAGAGRLELQGDATKSLRDFEVKLPGDGSDAQMSLAV